MPQAYVTHGRRIPIVIDTDAPSQTERVLRAVALCGLGLLIGFDVLAFGGVEEWSIVMLECGATVLLLVTLVGKLVRNRGRIDVPPAVLPMALFAVLIVTQIAFRLSAYRYVSYSGLLLYASYGMLFLVAAATACEQSDYRRVGIAVALFGSAVAVFSIIQELASNGKLYWLFDLRQGAVIFGPYVNHNHYAGLMELLIPVPFVLGTTHIFSGGKRALLLFGGVVMAGSVVLSLSRGGLIAVLAEFLFLLGFYIRSDHGRRSARLAIGAFLLIMIFLTLFDTMPILERIETIGHVTEVGVAGERLMIARDGLKMIAIHPVVGWGLGTFPAIYPKFRGYYTNMFINQAHNDWLQMIVETGAIGLLLTCWFLFLVYRNGFRNARCWYREPRAAMNLSALAGITGLLVHSFSDFNLHIPANAALFFTLCGLTFANVTEPKSNKAFPR